MPMQNPFNRPEFNMANLTAAINEIDAQFGLVSSLGLFQTKSLTTRTAIVEKKLFSPSLLAVKPVGAPGEENTDPERKVISFAVPHIPLDDTILPDDYANIRAFGQENTLQTLSEIMADKLFSLRQRHELTIDFMKMGAIKGVIKDGNGTTIYNLYDEFGLTQSKVNFALATSTTDVAAKCREVKRIVRRKAKGQRITGYVAICASDFYDALIAHDSVRETYLHYEAASTLRRDSGSGFTFGNITFLDCTDVAVDLQGNEVKYVEDGTAYVVPTGTQLFHTYYAPADFIETVNTRGRRIYVKQKARDYNRGIDIHSQSNPLPICLNPEVVVKLTKS